METIRNKANEYNVINARVLGTPKMNVPIYSKTKLGILGYSFNEETKDERKYEKDNNVISFSARLGYKIYDQKDGESSDEELLDEDVAKAYKLMYVKWK